MNDHIDEEINFEPEEEMGDIGAAQAKIIKLRDQLKEAQEKRDEYLDGWQRCKADSINARKEAALRHDLAHGRGKESVLEDIIPVLDSFDMAAAGEAWLAIDETWRSGVDLIRNQLLDVLSRHGIERFGKVGDQFDHQVHEAVQEVDDMPGKAGRSFAFFDSATKWVIV